MHSRPLPFALLLTFSLSLALFATTPAHAALPAVVQQRTGDLIAEGKQGEAFALLLPFAKSGDPAAQYALGLLLLTDAPALPSADALGVPRTRLALCWFEQAALQGHAEACTLLADAYEKGQNGVPAQPRLATLWRTLAGEAATKKP